MLSSPPGSVHHLHPAMHGLHFPAIAAAPPYSSAGLSPHFHASGLEGTMSPTSNASNHPALMFRQPLPMLSPFSQPITLEQLRRLPPQAVSDVANGNRNNMIAFFNLQPHAVQSPPQGMDTAQTSGYFSMRPASKSGSRSGSTLVSPEVQLYNIRSFCILIAYILLLHYYVYTSAVKTDQLLL
jgi:hypothetical protein